jgi:ACS family tartrate transporter-like MFS transporter
MNIQQAVFKKLFTKLLPLIMFMYFLSFVDRANIGIASLTMNQDLGISTAAYGLGAGLFFIGYFIFGLPSNIMLAKLGARKWISCILLVWGLISTSTMFVRSAEQLYVVRFLLGVAEAGFYPGIIFYLGNWFPADAKARAFTYFHMSLAISMCVGNVLSGLILQMDGLANMAGWQWVFLCEGFPAVICSFVAYRVLLDSPKDASWLNEEEKTWLINQLETEKGAKVLGNVSTMEVLKKLPVWHLSIIYLTLNTGFYGIIFWLPQIVKEMTGANNTITSLLSAIPWLVALVVMFFVAGYADRAKKKKLFVAVPIFIGGLGLILGTYLKSYPVLALSALSISTAACECCVGPFWTFPSRMFNGVTGAVAIAIVNAIGNLSGFVGPYVFGIVTKGGNFRMGLIFLAAMMVVSGMLAMFLKEVDEGKSA